MRICIDMDGVLCHVKRTGESYADVAPIPGAAERIRALRAAGHYVIVHTARHMKTCNGNVGMVMARVGEITVNWLRRHGIEYDELYFGKPHADVYIDDNAYRFHAWDAIAGDGSTLPLNHEKQRERAKMTLVMPMAGRGSRFQDAGWKLPKPLIDVRGRPMYSWAMDGLPLADVRRVVFICLREHLSGLGLEADIKTRYAAFDPVVIALDGVTEGQACTVLTAREHIDNADPLLIFNADTYCRTNLERTLPRCGDDVKGVLGVFRAPGEKWSFARLDEKGDVVETAEKKRISEWASTGLYYFRHGADYVRHADAMIAANERVNNEFYVAPIYNRMIAAGERVRIDPAQEVWVLGTPEDLAVFEMLYP